MSGNDLTSGDELKPVTAKIAAQPARNEAAIQLLAEWMADQSGYDERAWPTAKRVIEENRLSGRKRFSD